ncbi:retrotransposon protein, putative, ty1-copia subclass [Tanacetum coccineum]
MTPATTARSYGTHICNTKHGLGGVRKLKQVEANGSFDLVLPNGLVICLDNCHYAPSILRGVVSVHRLVENGFVQRFTDFGISISKICNFIVVARFWNFNFNFIVVARYAEFFEKNLITQEVSRRARDLEEIQDEDTSPSKITSEVPIEVEEMEEHSLGDLNEPTSYKAAMLDSESNKWIDAMNAEIQSMMDNMVWVLVDLPPGCKTVGKTFSPVADIRAIRILISIAAFYDYEIWQMDVKTAFLNGYLDEDIYMV